MKQLNAAAHIKLFKAVLVRVSDVLTKDHDQKQLGKERVYFSSPLSGHTASVKDSMAENPGRNLEAGTEAEAKNECVERLIFMACLACSFIQPRTIPPMAWVLPD